WVLLLPVTKTIASLMGYPFGEGPIVLQKLTLADPVLLLTAVGGWLGARGSSGALRERQGRRIVGLLAAFCTVGILSATLGPTGSESLIELATYFWLCLSLVVICKLLGTRERARRVLSAWRWAGGVACAAGGAATVLLWRGNLDNLLVQGGRVAGRLLHRVGLARSAGHEPAPRGPAPRLAHGLRRAPAPGRGTRRVRRDHSRARAGRTRTGNAQLVSRRARRDRRRRQSPHVRVAGGGDGQERDVPASDTARARPRGPDGCPGAARLLPVTPPLRDAEL